MIAAAIISFIVLSLPMLCESELLKEKAGRSKAGKKGQEPHPIKTVCVIPSMIDLIKEGMQLFYEYKAGECPSPLSTRWDAALVVPAP